MNFVLPHALISRFYLCMSLCSMHPTSSNEVYRRLRLKKNRDYARFMEMIYQLVQTTAIQPLSAEKVLSTKHHEIVESLDGFRVLCDNFHEN